MTTKLAPLGIKRLEGIHYYVHDLERSRKFYVDKLDFSETWRSSPEVEAKGRQQAACFQAGNVMVLCSSPIGEGGRAARFLSKHPDGVGTLIFEVEDAERTFKLLEERGGTPIADIETSTDDGGTLRQFSITTPFGDCTFGSASVAAIGRCSPVRSRTGRSAATSTGSRRWTTSPRTSRP